MSWNDGISKQMNDFIQDVLAQVSPETKDAITEEVDKFSINFEKEIEKTLPRDTNELLNSFTKTNESSNRWYGYQFEFKGSNKHGVPYEKIANVLNYGRPEGISKGIKYGTIAPRKFMIKAIRKLKKLDPAINDNFESKMQKLNEKI